MPVRRDRLSVPSGAEIALVLKRPHRVKTVLKTPSNWLVKKAKVEPKTVQGILRHSKTQTTLALYTQEDSDETRAAQGKFLSAVGMNAMIN